MRANGRGLWGFGVRGICNGVAILNPRSTFGAVYNIRNLFSAIYLCPWSRNNTRTCRLTFSLVSLRSGTALEEERERQGKN